MSTQVNTKDPHDATQFFFFFGSYYNFLKLFQDHEPNHYKDFL